MISHHLIHYQSLYIYFRCIYNCQITYQPVLQLCLAMYYLDKGMHRWSRETLTWKWQGDIMIDQKWDSRWVYSTISHYWDGVFSHSVQLTNTNTTSLAMSPYAINFWSQVNSFTVCMVCSSLYGSQIVLDCFFFNHSFSTLIVLIKDSKLVFHSKGNCDVFNLYNALTLFIA